MANIAEQETTKQDEWKYYLWECRNTHPTMKPLGRKQRDGCGHWNLRKTKKIIGDEKAQSKCNECGRRKRLSPQNTYLRLFLDKAYAEKEQGRLNGGA
jgi:hypothetical protein